jgi:hypothetical protein
LYSPAVYRRTHSAALFWLRSVFVSVSSRVSFRGLIGFRKSLGLVLRE